MIKAICTQGKGVDMDRARRLASQFEVKIITTLPDDKEAMYFLLDKSGIALVSGKQVLKGDFTRLLNRVTNGHLPHEILLKATKPPADIYEKTVRAVDCTAGLGEDSFILAALGYHVEMFEHNEITATLLQDAIIRGRNNPQIREIVGRMNLKKGDSKELLQELDYKPELIYLDPMFPEKKKSAESKKKLQILHRIETPCSDENELVQAAIEANPKKIVIKRPPDGPYLAGLTPSYSVTRKAVRYDCLVYS